MRRTILSLFATLALMLLFLVPTPVAADTYADVAVNATPAYISITVAPAGYNFGTLATSSTTNTTDDYFTMTNSSTIATNITISVTGATWTGGTAWTHAEDGVPGADTVGLNSTTEAGGWGTGVIVKNAAPLTLQTNLAAITNLKFGLSIRAPTSFSDGVEKQNTVRLTAAA